MAKGRFQIIAGPLEGKDFEIGVGESVVIGRSSQASLPIDDNTVSKIHCKFFEKDGAYWIEDMRSRNGVLLNKEKVEKAVLRSGDGVALGKTKIEFKVGGETGVQTAIRPAVGAPTQAFESAPTRKAAFESLRETRDVDDIQAEFMKDEPKRAENEAIFGRIALLNGMITQVQLDDALSVQSKSSPRRPLGEILVERKALSAQQRDLLLQIQSSDEGERERDYQDRKREFIFAKLAVKKGYLTEANVLECIKLQRECEREGLKMNLDELLKKKGYLTRTQAEEIFKQQSREGVGKEIEGYQILEMIGHGGMGAVYKARQLSMDRVVAIKILSEKYKDRPEYTERFLQEARTVAKLNHENIIAGIDFGKVGDLSYFVMEYVDGPTVLDLLREEKRVDPERALDIVLQVARALDHAHKRGLVHQDIKPDNVMLGEGGIVKLCDLGLAKNLDEDSGGRAIGTANYMAPEQIMGTADVDIRADIYSLGVTLYRMLYGKLPYKGQSPAVVMSKHLNEPLEFPPEPSETPVPQLLTIMQKMMSKRREDRYQTPRELLDVLERIREELENAFGPEGAEEEETDGAGGDKKPLRRRLRRRRRRF